MPHNTEKTVRRTFGRMHKLPASFVSTIGASMRVPPCYSNENPGVDATKYVDFVRTKTGVVGIMEGQRYVVLGRE